MCNYMKKLITVIAIIPYILKWLNKENIINKREENDLVEWGQFIELDNYNRDKMC